MNKLIQKLADECTSVDGTTFDKGQFAIAIIAECIFALTDGLDQDVISDETIEKCHEANRKLQKHFGDE